MRTRVDGFPEAGNRLSVGSSQTCKYVNYLAEKLTRLASQRDEGYPSWDDDERSWMPESQDAVEY